MNCKHEHTKVITKDETYPVLGEPITIVATVKVCCDCGEELFDYYLDNDNLKMAFTKFNEVYPERAFEYE